MTSKPSLRISIGPIHDEFGGVSQHILNIIKYSAHKFEKIKYSPFSLYYPKYKGIGWTLLKHPNIPIKDLYGLFFAKVILPKFDIVHTHGHPYWHEIYQKPKDSSAKYIHTVHQIYYKDESRNQEEWIGREKQNERLVEYCREVDAVIAVSKYLQTALLENYGLDSLYIPTAVDLEYCKHIKPQRFRMKYGIKDDFYLFVGSLLKVKQPESFVKLATMLPNRKFVMIGNGLTRDEMSVLIPNVPKNILCLGRLRHQDVMDAIGACKVIVVTSMRESLSTIVLEGMCCKKPVAAGNTSGMKELIVNQVDGFLFESTIADDLYEKACLAWEHPKVGLRAYEKAKEKFNWKVIIKKIDELYERIVEE